MNLADTSTIVLIETLWNVNKPEIPQFPVYDTSINRNIVECKAL